MGGGNNVLSISTTWYVLWHFHTYVIRHAVVLNVLLHSHTYVMLRCWTFSCTSTHTSCYAAERSLALPHMRHATLLDVLLHFDICVMLRWTFSRTSTHKSCYAAGRSLALPTHTSCYAAGHSLALAHIRHATLLDVLLHFHNKLGQLCA